MLTKSEIRDKRRHLYGVVNRDGRWVSTRSAPLLREGEVRVGVRVERSRADRFAAEVRAARAVLLAREERITAARAVADAKAAKVVRQADELLDVARRRAAQQHAYRAWASWDYSERVAGRR